MTDQAQTVLILDDDDAVRQSFQNFFADRQWRVLSATTAEDALEVVAQETPDCVVTDIRLPGMDGNGFIRLVNETHPTLACVICTGSPEYHLPNGTDAIAQVSHQVFTKPVMDLRALEEELCRQIDICSGN